MNGDVRGIVVLTSGWALRMARAHSRLLGTDCKHDTSAGRSMWSSARAATPRGWVPTVAWIAPTEDTQLIHAALLVLAENVACHDPSCNHAVQIEWGQHGHPGSYRRRRVCRRWYQPRGSAATSICPHSRQRRWRAMVTLSSVDIILTTVWVSSSKELACKVRGC